MHIIHLSVRVGVPQTKDISSSTFKHTYTRSIERQARTRHCHAVRKRAGLCPGTPLSINNASIFVRFSFRTLPAWPDGTFITSGAGRIYGIRSPCILAHACFTTATKIRVHYYTHINRKSSARFSQVDQCDNSLGIHMYLHTYTCIEHLIKI